MLCYMIFVHYFTMRIVCSWFMMFVCVSVHIWVMNLTNKVCKSMIIWVKLHINWWIINVWRLDIFSLVVAGRFGVNGWKIGVLFLTLLQKIQFLLLVKGDGSHPNDALVVIVLEALMGVSFLRSSSSLSPVMFG